LLGERRRAPALIVARLLERDAELRQLSGLARRVGRDPGRGQPGLGRTGGNRLAGR
jgi:hypothetical protein